MNSHLKNGLSIFTFIFSSCLATSALASGPPPAKPYFDGFYAGLGGGVVSSTANVKNHYTAGGTTNGSDNMDLGKHGLNGNIFVGFGRTLKSVYYMGIELIGNLFSPEMKSSNPPSPVLLLNMRTKVKSPYSYGGDIRAGYLISPRVMFYALFGLDYAKFKVKSNATYPAQGITNNFSEWELGFMPGVGIEVGLADHLSLRAQYTYTFYPSFSHMAFNPSSVQVLDTKVDADRGLFTLMLSWLFN